MDRWNTITERIREMEFLIRLIRVPLPFDFEIISLLVLDFNQ